MFIRKLCSLFLIGFIAFIPLRDIVIYSHFYMDQDFIADLFCVNKNDAPASCNGKCFLKKQLSEKHDHQNTPQQLEERRHITFFLSLSDFIVDYIERTKTVRPIDYHHMWDSSYQANIFHPPRQLS